MRWLALIVLVGVACRSEPSRRPQAKFVLDVGARVNRSALTPSGTIVVATAKEVLGFREGERAWGQELPLAPWLVALADESVVTRGSDSRLLAFDAATGRTVWTVGSRIETDEPLDAADLNTLGRFAWAAPQALARTSSAGKETLVSILEDGRILRVSPERCRARDARACSRVVGRLEGRELSSALELETLSDGSLVLIDVDGLSVFGPTGAFKLALRANELMSGARPHGRHLVVAIDDKVVALDPDRCASLLPISLTGTSSASMAPPPGCVVWSRPAPGLALHAPAIVGDQIIANAGDGTVFATSEATARVDLEAIGPVIARTHSPEVVTLAASSGDGRLRVLEIDAKDRSVKEARLPIELPGLVVSSNELVLQVAGSFVLAGYGSRIALVSLSR
ncbi:MAG: PQQ-binding-like beta-propeller repeat protein [Deltaproteobacteria bacterium]|nr:PQQ-binding-like beta-propeller repeat protein [Deltaproteobacteria bacterium]